MFYRGSVDLPLENMCFEHFTQYLLRYGHKTYLYNKYIFFNFFKQINIVDFFENHLNLIIFLENEYFPNGISILLVYEVIVRS